MCEFNTKITISQLLRLTIVSAKSKIYSPSRGYLAPGNSIVLEIAATLLFINVTNFFADFGAHFVETSTLPTDLFMFVNPSRLHMLTEHYPQNPPVSHFNPGMRICSKITNMTLNFKKGWKYHINLFKRKIY